MKQALYVQLKEVENAISLNREDLYWTEYKSTEEEVFIDKQFELLAIRKKVVTKLVELGETEVNYN